MAALPGAGDAALAAVVTELYAARESLGEAAFGTLLARVRTALRAALDRRLTWSA